MLSAEVSLYPQKTTNASKIINDAVQTLAHQNISYQVGSMSTHIQGSDRQVWDSIKFLFETAKNSGAEVNMVLTISNAAD